MPGVSQRIITVPSWGTAGAGCRAVGAEPSPPLTPQAARPQAAPLLGFDLPGFAPAAPFGPGASLPRVPAHIVPIACPRCAPPLATAVSMGNVAARLLLASCSTSQGCGVLRAYFTPWAAAQPDPPAVHKPTESHISGSQLPGRVVVCGSACPRLPHVALPPCPRSSLAGPDGALVRGAGGR